MSQSQQPTLEEMKQVIRQQKIKQSEECLEKVKKVVEEDGCIFYAESFLTPTGTIAARMVMTVKEG